MRRLRNRANGIDKCMLLFTQFCFKNGLELCTLLSLPRSSIPVCADFSGCGILNPHAVILKMAMFDSYITHYTKGG